MASTHEDRLSIGEGSHSEVSLAKLLSAADLMRSLPYSNADTSSDDVLGSEVSETATILSHYSAMALIIDLANSVIIDY
ncbi:hypothetical protein ANCCAN_06846 [Ancylostoma caninum]|uniref:Uncharacterized protein n=1 Tax=Ancylostoma caninum TaxID=29170 RepID=A0A368GRW8_ANCCA|nr:hypothetical protein ANCCAN_06846 [Ancylostoma caninum]